jgi:hypothetical protein
LHPLEIHAVGGERLHDLRHSVGTIGNENTIDLARGLRNAAGDCWGADFSVPTENDADRFKAKSD